MPEHLMSVRFDGQTLDLLRTLAEVHNTSVAEEVRAAVARYISQVRNDADFHRKLQEANALREARIRQLTG